MSKSKQSARDLAAGAAQGAVAGAAPPDLQPRGNAAAQAALAAAPGGAEQDPGEHTIFVDGTWQDRAPEYWPEDVQGAAQDVFGADTAETFSWYGGPNDARARELAGRKLYHEAVLPTLERGQELNLVAHSHGGNVVGEMGAYADQRREHVDLMSRAAENTGISGIGTDLAAYASIGGQLLGVGMDALSLHAEEVERHGSDDLQDTNRGLGLRDEEREAARQAMLAQLGEQAQGLLADGRAVATGDTERFASEREALAGADMGDAIFANVPWLSEHDHPLDSGLLSGLDRVDSFQNDGDMVRNGAQRLSGDEGDRILTDREVGPDGPDVHEHTWERQGGSLTDFSFNHSAAIRDGDAFREEYGSAIDPERYATEEEARAAREAEQPEQEEGGGGFGFGGLFGGD